MAKPLKVLLITLGVLLLALAGLVTAAIVFFDANALRERITVAVKKETGRELLLGDIQLGFFPWIKAEISGISLSNAPGFGPQPMLTAESLTLGVKLLPLLRDRQVQASTLRLAGVNVQLAVNAEGISNWADLSTPAETPATDTPAPDTAPLEQLDTPTLVNVQLG